jgi:hypothetical protein
VLVPFSALAAMAGLLSFDVGSVSGFPVGAGAKAGAAAPPPSGDAAAALAEHGGSAGRRLGWSLPVQREQGTRWRLGRSTIA